MNHTTLSTLLDVFVDVGAHAVIVGAFVLWCRRELRRHPEYRNDK